MRTPANRTIIAVMVGVVVTVAVARDCNVAGQQHRHQEQRNTRLMGAERPNELSPPEHGRSCYVWAAAESMIRPQIFPICRSPGRHRDHQRADLHALMNRSRAARRAARQPVRPRKKARAPAQEATATP